jgi:hypothetical protein
MGILSSLFQTGAPTQQVAGPAIATSKLPEELAPYYKDILGKAQALYNERTGEGFQPYQGPTIADFTPEQQQAFTGISGLVGQQAPVFQEAMDLTRSAAAPMTSEQMTQYMSPYQQAVTDIEKREATKQYESQVVPQLAAKAATTGGFGGSRQAILEGMAADTQQRLLSDIQAKGSQQSYQDAVKRFQADRTAAGQAGAQLATMAPNQFKAQLGELGAIQTIGEEKQRQQQTALDEAFRQYQLERNYPYDTMSKYQSVVTGAPVQTTQFAKPADPTPSIGQQLIGGIGTLGAAYGAFTGNNPLSLLQRKSGGGLDTLPIVYRQQEGQVFVPEMGSGEDYSVINAGSGMLQGLTEPDFYPRLPGETDSAYRQRVRDLTAGKEERFTTFANAKKIAEAAKAEGQGKEFQDSMIIPERELDPDVQKTIDERNALMNKNKTNTNIIEPIEVTRNTDTDDGGINAIDALQSATGNTFFEGTPRPDYPTIDASGLEGLRASTNQLNANINSFIKANEGRMSSEQLREQIENNFGADLRALEEFQTNEQNILAQQMAEDAEERGKYFDTESATAKDAMQRQQYGNLAQFFARLGTASPKQEGLAGVLGAGLEAADATLPQAMQTQQAYQDRLAGLRGDRRAEEKSDKVISRTEQKSIRKDLYTGKKDLTKSKREDLIAANDRDIDIASKTIAARSQGLASKTDLVNAEISLGQAQNENAILALQFAEDTDFSDVFPDPNEGNNIMIPILGGDAYKNRPELNKQIGIAWNRAYAEVVAEIKKQDKILRKDDLTKQEVTFAIQNLAKSYLDANLPQKPPPGNNVETEDSAVPDKILSVKEGF